MARSILLLEQPDWIARLLLGLPLDGDLLLVSHHKSSYGERAPRMLFERVGEQHPVVHGSIVARLRQVEELTGDSDDELISSQRPRGWRRKVARALIERFLLGGPLTSEDLEADVRVVEEISKETFERARAELAAEAVIERFQNNGRHWWRLAVPNVVPEDL